MIACNTQQTRTKKERDYFCCHTMHYNVTNWHNALWWDYQKAGGMVCWGLRMLSMKILRRPFRHLTKHTILTATWNATKLGQHWLILPCKQRRQNAEKLPNTPVCFLAFPALTHVREAYPCRQETQHRRKRGFIHNFKHWNWQHRCCS